MYYFTVVFKDGSARRCHAESVDSVILSVGGMDAFRNRVSRLFKSGNRGNQFEVSLPKKPDITWLKPDDDVTYYEGYGPGRVIQPPPFEQML